MDQPAQRDLPLILVAMNARCQQHRAALPTPQDDDGNRHKRCRIRVIRVIDIEVSGGDALAIEVQIAVDRAIG
jgi:hypothetical protein